MDKIDYTEKERMAIEELDSPEVEYTEGCR